VLKTATLAAGHGDTLALTKVVVVSAFFGVFWAFLLEFSATTGWLAAQAATHHAAFETVARFGVGSAAGETNLSAWAYAFGAGNNAQ
jgi:hypothetical protein